MTARPSVTAIILAYNRRESVLRVLDRLAEVPVDEVIVFDSGSSDGTAAAVRSHPDARVRVLESADNVAVAGRNRAAAAARGELLLMLDDDSYPTPGAMEALADLFERDPRLGAAGGFVRDVDQQGAPLRGTELGTFDWFLRAGRRGDPPSAGAPAFFFPEGASMVRRTALLEVEGFFEPYFFTESEVDVATRLLAGGWDVRYLPDAVFEHRKEQAGRAGGDVVMRLRVRNQIWYFWRHFPATLAVRRIPAYALALLVEAVYRRSVRAWAAGIADAWTHRDAVRGTRRPLPRHVLRRAEMNRGRMHIRLLAGQLVKKLAALLRPSPNFRRTGRGVPPDPAGYRGQFGPRHPVHPDDVSAVICTLGRPELLEHALARWAECVPSPGEVLVVDGDRARSAEPAAANAPIPVRYLATEPGLTHQRNRGLAEAKGAVVLFLDDDATPAPDLLVHVAGAYEDPAVVGVTGRVVEPGSHRIGGKESRLRRALPGGGHQGGFTRYGYPHRIVDVDVPRDVELMAGCFMSARTPEARAVGFDELLPGYGLAEDEDFSCRLARRGRIRYVPDAVVEHANEGFGTRDRRAFGRQVVVHRAYLFRKNFEPTVLARIQFGGLIGVLAMHRVLNRDWSGARGLVEGAVAVRRGEDPSGPTNLRQ